MAKIYAQKYGLLPFAGSDNHVGSRQTALAGISAVEPITDELDFIEKFKRGEIGIFSDEL